MLSQAGLSVCVNCIYHEKQQHLNLATVAVGAFSCNHNKFWLRTGMFPTIADLSHASSCDLALSSRSSLTESLDRQRCKMRDSSSAKKGSCHLQELTAVHIEAWCDHKSPGNGTC